MPLQGRQDGGHLHEVGAGADDVCDAHEWLPLLASGPALLAELFPHPQGRMCRNGN
jgi:hypothetical protein